MRKDLILNKPIYSSFLSCPQDIRQILQTLFIESRPYSDLLKRLLIINNPDCLDSSNTQYQQVIDKFSLGDLIDRGYIRLNPKIARGTHEEIKSYIIISFDNFSLNKNPVYMDYDINFDIICYNDAWVLNDLKIRPLMICGYIDGILNSLNSKNYAYQTNHKPQIRLTGIGTYKFLNCNEVVLNEDLSMYSLSYHGIHFSEDISKIGEINRND